MPGQRIDRVGLTGSLPKHGVRMRIEKRGAKFSKVPVKGNIHKIVELV
jgi:hypothetical protein